MRAATNADENMANTNHEEQHDKNESNQHTRNSRTSQIHIELPRNHAEASGLCGRILAMLGVAHEEKGQGIHSASVYWWGLHYNAGPWHFHWTCGADNLVHPSVEKTQAFTALPPPPARPLAPAPGVGVGV